jgi:hypothetical protein
MIYNAISDDGQKNRQRCEPLKIVVERGTYREQREQDGADRAEVFRWHSPTRWAMLRLARNGVAAVLTCNHHVATISCRRLKAKSSGATPWLALSASHGPLA